MLKRIVTYFNIPFQETTGRRYISSSIFELSGRHYSHVQYLGEGAHAQAYHGINDECNREVTLRFEMIHDLEERERVQREMKIQQLEFEYI